MNSQVFFNRKHEWALLPFKAEVNDLNARESTQQYENSFRWFRRTRTAELCLPWKLAHQIGWLIPSPVDVTVSPVAQIEVARLSDEDLRDAATTLGTTEVWKRDESVLCSSKTEWLRLYDFRVDDHWESMFVPNGEGTIEWRLGWDIAVPSKHCVYIFSTGECPGLDVPSGLLTEVMVSRARSTGISIAIRPTCRLNIRRGQPLARLLVIPQECLNLTSREVDT
jgi:hypothetical protein